MQLIMRLSPVRALVAGLGIYFGLQPALLHAETQVLTYHYNNARTGFNPAEQVLTPRNVNAASFGKLYTVPVDGKVDAQPLLVSHVAVGRGDYREIVYVATEHDSVYAFDARNGSILWQVSLLKAGETTSDSLSCTQVVPEIGITATPVIDLKTGPHGTIYVVAMSKNSSGTYYQRIHALDLAAGAEELGGPVTIGASVPGTGKEGRDGMQVFDPKVHEDRAALLLVNGIVYTTWTSHCDRGSYTGWSIGYEAKTLKQVNVFNFDPNGSEGSIWGSGAGPAADGGGNLFFTVANGTFDTALDVNGFPRQGNYGNAVVKFGPSQALQVADYWTMYNTVSESDRDLDLGSGALMLLPDVQDGQGNIRHLGVVAGKDQTVYVIDRDNMGKFNSNSNANVYQQLPTPLAGREYGVASWFNGIVYLGASGDVLRAYSIVNGRLSQSPASTSATVFPFPGSSPVVSANDFADAIVWAYDNSASAVLHAYDASNLNRELYNSNQAPSGRDNLGAGNKFISPVVANGRVFVGTTNSVVAFGLLPR